MIISGWRRQCHIATNEGYAPICVNFFFPSWGILFFWRVFKNKTVNRNRWEKMHLLCFFVFFSFSFGRRRFIGFTQETHKMWYTSLHTMPSLFLSRYTQCTHIMTERINCTQIVVIVVMHYGMRWENDEIEKKIEDERQSNVNWTKKEGEKWEFFLLKNMQNTFVRRLPPRHSATILCILNYSLFIYLIIMIVVRRWRIWIKCIYCRSMRCGRQSPYSSAKVNAD